MNPYGELLTLPGCGILQLAVVDFSVLFWGQGFPMCMAQVGFKLGTGCDLLH